jgi:hypothetical protein
MRKQEALMVNCATSLRTCLAALLAISFTAEASPARPSDAPRPLRGHTPAAVANGSATLIGAFDPSQRLRLVLGLQPTRTAEQEQLLRDLHAKGSPLFHHFLSLEEWTARFGPAAADEQAVVAWAQGQGLTVTHRYPNRLLVDVEAPVATIERALQVRMGRYRLGARSFFANASDPVIPARLAGVVQSVLGLNDLQVPRPMGQRAPTPTRPLPLYAAGPAVTQRPSARKNATPGRPRRAPGRFLSTNGFYDPTDIYSSQAYDYDALQRLGHCCNPLHDPNGSPAETSIAIPALADVDGNDLDVFQQNYPYLAYNWRKVFVDGIPAADDSYSREGAMDLEWATAMANSFGSFLDTATVWLYEGGTPSNAVLTDIYNQMLSDGHARILSSSISCGPDVGDFSSGCDGTVINTQHGIFNAMIGTGWTLVGASGDRGATADCDRTSVFFPASDPNFVGVGGTLLSLDASSSFLSEVGWTGGTDSGSCHFNDGGSGGGCSARFSRPDYQGETACGTRAVPDIALNAQASQNFVFQGALDRFGGAGTSIATPEMAGFFAQENAYLLYVGSIIGDTCGNSVSSPCAPLGNANYYLYGQGINQSAPHHPFYDVTSGCNSNDATVGGVQFYCAGQGYDLVTGWGSANMLQLAWAINWFLASDAAAPIVDFSGPPVNQWTNSDQTISWTASDPTNGYAPTGVAGYSAAWDFDPGDPTSHATPGAGDSFYSGPWSPNATTSATTLSNAGLGCHTLHVRAWDNTGASQDSTYGPVCFDTVQPSTSASASGTKVGSVFVPPVTVTLSATDDLSGVARTEYQLDGAPLKTYTQPFKVSALGSHSVVFHSTDNAGNIELRLLTLGFTIQGRTTTALASSANPSTSGKSVTFTATVTSTSAGTPTGSVTFKDGTTTLATKTLSGGKATFTTSSLTVGTHSITAAYAGDTSFLASTSQALSQKVTR